MSQENVEIVRRAFDAVRHGDHLGATRGFHADAVWHNTADFPGESTCVGPQAIIDFCRSMEEPFEGAIDIERIIEGDDSVVLGFHSTGRGKASGVPLDFYWAAAFRVHNGKISRVDVHGDWLKALNAVGLAE